jgi:FtsZ-interacting cell division protein ZipA
MDSSTILWIVIAIIVVLAVVLFLWRSRGQEASHRAKAAEIRQTAAEHDLRLREQEAEATRTRAQAQAAETDAQQRQVEAERLAAEAEDRAKGAEAVRSERDEQLRLADLRDPDVRTDDDGNRLDDDGNRVDPATGTAATEEADRAQAERRT